MEISLREWLVIGGVVVIALIIIDGWRRVRGGRNSLRMDIDRRFRDLPDEPTNEANNPELPYGGARRAGGTVSEAAATEPVATPAAKKSVLRPSHERIEPTFGDSVSSEPSERPTQPAVQSFSAREPEPEVRNYSDKTENEIPAFDALSGEDLDTDELGKPRPARPGPSEGRPTQPENSEPLPAAVQAETVPQAAPQGPFTRTRLDEIDPLFDELPDDFPEPEPEIPAPVPEPVIEPEPQPPALDLEKPVPMLMERVRKPRDTTVAEDTQQPVEQSEMPLGPAPESPAEPSRPRPVRAAKPMAEEAPQQDSLFAEPEPARPAKSTPSGGRNTVEMSDPEHVLVITVVSTDEEGFPGGAMRRILEACDLHFGEMNIFHRHEDGSDSGPVQFSMANAVNPGTFDLDTIESMHTPGVTFFMAMEEPRDVMNAFECMLATAETLARHLNGDLLDENRSVLRPQTKEHYRQRIRDYEMHNRSRRSATRA